MMVMLSLVFVWSIQPYTMIISMIVMTLGYSMYIYYSMGSYWYSYMLVLVMMSGVLVLFTYIASLVPNESFEYMSLVNVGLFIYMIMLLGMTYKIMYYGDISMLLVKVWNMGVSMYNLYLVTFLLVVMVMVVWLSSFDSGAVRNF